MVRYLIDWWMDAWGLFPYKQKAIGVSIVGLGVLSSLITTSSGIHDITFLVAFAVPVGMYLLLTKEQWIS